MCGWANELTPVKGAAVDHGAPVGAGAEGPTPDDAGDTPAGDAETGSSNPGKPVTACDPAEGGTSRTGSLTGTYFDEGRRDPGVLAEPKV